VLPRMVVQRPAWAYAVVAALRPASTAAVIDAVGAIATTDKPNEAGGGAAGSCTAWTGTAANDVAAADTATAIAAALEASDGNASGPAWIAAATVAVCSLYDAGAVEAGKHDGTIVAGSSGVEGGGFALAPSTRKSRIRLTQALEMWADWHCSCLQTVQT
jgi:hypothetical protein